MDLVLLDALLPDGRRMDVSVTDGRISEITPAGAPAAAGRDSVPVATTPDVQVHDLHGQLLLPAMAEPHAHLDKALVADTVVNRTGDLSGAIDAMVAAAGADLFGHDGIVARATLALDRLVANGVTAVRTHVNVGSEIGAEFVVAIQEVRTMFAGIVDLQIVALTHSPMTGHEGRAHRAALDAAVEAGVDLVGGCPHLDPDGAGLIGHALRIAADAGIGVDLHMDETLDPEMMTLFELARQVSDTGFAHGVSASHCVSLAMQPLDVQHAVARALADARISVIPLPQTNLFLQGRSHPVAMPRALTPITVLRDAGVLVAAGGDNVQDPFNPVGRSDGLETAALLVMAAHQLPDDAFELVSNAPRRVLGLEPVTMSVGDPADFVAIDATSTRHAIADAPAARRVYRRGRLVAVTSTTRTVHR